jgi:hypothetical protein
MEYPELRAAIARLRADAERIAHALHQHVADERDPIRHGALHRLHGVLRDFLATPAVAP